MIDTGIFFMRRYASLVFTSLLFMSVTANISSLYAGSHEFRVAGTAQTAQANDPPAHDRGGRRR